MASSEAIDYIKQPAMKFLKDSYSLVNKCTKPDRNGEPLNRMHDACVAGQRFAGGRGEALAKQRWHINTAA